MPTLREVAKAANVSTVTASSVLSGANRVRVSPETSRRIIDIAKTMNYVPRAAARGLRTGRVQAIGFITHPRMYWQPHWQEMLRGISDLLWDRGERLILSLPKTEDQEEEMMRQLAFGHQVDGLIIQNAGKDEQRINLLRESTVPFVSIDGDPEQDNHVVAFDMLKFGSLLAADILKEAGAVALLSGKPQVASEFDFIEGCRQGTGAGGNYFEHWNGAFLPDGKWLGEIRAKAGAKPLGVILTRHLLPELLGILDSSGLRFETDIKLMYLAGSEEVIQPPKGMRVIHLDHYTLGRQAAKLLFRLIDDKENQQQPARNLILPGMADELLGVGG
ncbi:MAG: LacI family DNA-binding transcriptional regulator [Planctomycetes bacterium]|nr:LacI family DNA-binding transcriptional regulator [Planctomycetota bacterium]